MPCSDSSSSLFIRVDHNECLLGFDFAKITCGRAIDTQKPFEKYCQGKTLLQILDFDLTETLQALSFKDEEEQFIFHLEWDVLRAAIAEYLGIDKEGVDRERCKISSITHYDMTTEIALVILPPKALPKILPCSLSNN